MKPFSRAVPGRLFVYGTLLDRDLFGVVAGIAQHKCRPALAILRGAHPARARAAGAPVLAAGGRTRGVLLKGFTQRAWRRLCFYEDKEYAPRLVPVRLGGGNVVTAAVFYGTNRPGPRTVAWSVTRWRRHEKRTALARARLFMDYLQAPRGTDLDAAWRDIQRRVAGTIEA